MLAGHKFGACLPTFGNCADRYCLSGYGGGGSTMEEMLDLATTVDGLDDPLPSLRMENLRAGLEDYDLIAIARNHQAELEEAGKTLDLKAAEVLKQLNTVPNPYVRSVIDYCRDPQELEALRRDLAEYIRQARKLLR